MASTDKDKGSGITAADISRFGVGVRSKVRRSSERRIPLAQSDRIMAAEGMELRRKVAISMVILAVLFFFSFCVSGARQDYAFYNPLEVVSALFFQVFNFLANTTQLFAPVTNAWLHENCPLYFTFFDRFGVLCITLLCAVLLAVSGALYQNVFRNPIAGPGMLGVGSGVSLGMMLLVYMYSGAAAAYLMQRYAMCYGFGAAILVFVILAGRKVSGKGRPFDIVSMLLIGSIVSQLIGFIVSYITLYVMDTSDYDTYYTLSQMLVVDTSWISWACLGTAFAVSFLPVWFMRFRLNALSFDEQEVRLMGIDPLRLRAVALICGAIMILAAQIHCGSIAMVSVIVPFLARSWFGCEFRKQLAGNICIGTILLLACRDIVDSIPFVGDGIAIGSIVAIVAMPIFLLIVAKHMRGWE